MKNCPRQCRVDIMKDFYAINHSVEAYTLLFRSSEITNDKKFNRFFRELKAQVRAEDSESKMTKLLNKQFSSPNDVIPFSSLREVSELNGKPVNALVDCGAESWFISQRLLARFRTKAFRLFLRVTQYNGLFTMDANVARESLFDYLKENVDRNFSQIAKLKIKAFA